MNRRVLPLIVGSLLLPLGCGDSDDQTDPPAALVLQPSELCSEQSDAAIATFEDANLAAAVADALSVDGEDDLTCGLVSGLTDLEAQDAKIESLAGVQNLTSLTALDLWVNSITDISALSGLTRLDSIYLNRNSIADIRALTGLTSLTYLHLGKNSITDIGPLSGLADLTFLNFRENSVSDISPLSGLTRLTNLDLTYNSISDMLRGCGGATGQWGGGELRLPGRHPRGGVAGDLGRRRCVRRRGLRCQA